MKRRIAKEQTTEELVELTRLAIEWGQVVLRYVFLYNFRLTRQA
jgi:hypothetical protein